MKIHFYMMKVFIILIVVYFSELLSHEKLLEITAQLKGIHFDLELCNSKPTGCLCLKFRSVNCDVSRLKKIQM